MPISADPHQQGTAEITVPETGIKRAFLKSTISAKDSIFPLPASAKTRPQGGVKEGEI